MNEYTHRYSLTAADIDTGYRMTPSAVLLYYQDCWARYMSKLHLAAFDLRSSQRMWVISELNTSFTPATALWSDELDVTVWNSRQSALRLYVEFRMKKTDGTEVACGYGCWTLLDTENHRLADSTPFASRIPVKDEVSCESYKKKRIPNEGELMQQIVHPVNPIDLDFNSHVNNRTYLTIAMQSANEQFINSHVIRSLTIHWLKETFLGDVMQCSLYRLPVSETSEEGDYVHTITRKDGEVVAQVYSRWIPCTQPVDVVAEMSRE